MCEEMGLLLGNNDSPRNPQQNSTWSKLGYLYLQRRLENRGVIRAQWHHEQSKRSVGKEKGKEWRSGRQRGCLATLWCVLLK